MRVIFCYEKFEPSGNYPFPITLLTTTVIVIAPEREGIVTTNPSEFIRFD
jgi:hypothetical protein